MLPLDHPLRKCHNCGKIQGYHRAVDSACPVGQKDRTGGYSYPLKSATVFTPKLTSKEEELMEKFRQEFCILYKIPRHLVFGPRKVKSQEGSE